MHANQAFDVTSIAAQVIWNGLIIVCVVNCSDESSGMSDMHWDGKLEHEQ